MTGRAQMPQPQLQQDKTPFSPMQDVLLLPLILSLTLAFFPKTCILCKRQSDMSKRLMKRKPYVIHMRNKKKGSLWLEIQGKVAQDDNDAHNRRDTT